MRYLCERCSALTPPAEFKVDSSGALSLTCASCRQVTYVAPVEQDRLAAAPPLVAGLGADASRKAAPGNARAPGPSGERPKVIPFRTGPDPARLALTALQGNPFEAPAGHCPKCVAERTPEALACHACGLLFENFSWDSVAPPPLIAEAWNETLKDWANWGAHERFLTLATQCGALATAGRLYRIRSVAAPGDPIAMKGREELLRLATLTPALGAASSASTDRVISGATRAPLWQYILLALLVVFALAAVGTLFRQIIAFSS